LQKGQFIFLCLKNFSSSKISKFDKYRLFIQHIVYLERIIAQEKKMPSPWKTSFFLMKNGITKVIHRRIISSEKNFPPKKQTALDSLFFYFFQNSIFIFQN